MLTHDRCAKFEEVISRLSIENLKMRECLKNISEVLDNEGTRSKESTLAFLCLIEINKPEEF